VRIERGRLISPSGIEYLGFKVTIGATDPADTKRTYEDIEKIFKSNQQTYHTFEERTEKGTFKRYIVET